MIFRVVAADAGEEPMRTTRLTMMAIGTLSILLWRPPSEPLVAQDAAPLALGGTVSSDEEGRMEGVVVTARRDGANFTVSVVSDAQGQYSFPRSHLASGAYTISIRAVGYDLADAQPRVDVAVAQP